MNHFLPSYACLLFVAETISGAAKIVVSPYNMISQSFHDYKIAKALETIGSATEEQKQSMYNTSKTWAKDKNMVFVVIYRINENGQVNKGSKFVGTFPRSSTFMNISITLSRTRQLQKHSLQFYCNKKLFSPNTILGSLLENQEVFLEIYFTTLESFG